MKEQGRGSWDILSETCLLKTDYFEVRDEKCRRSTGQLVDHYYVVRFPDWSHIIPLTDDGQVVLIRQYRHGARQWCWELPGGTVEEGESPLEAAKRELLEETGFRARHSYSVMTHYPNPALQANRLHTSIAIGCERIQEPAFDAHEEIEVVLKSLTEVAEMVKEHQFSHSLILASLALLWGPLELPSQVQKVLEQAGKSTTR